MRRQTMARGRVGTVQLLASKAEWFLGGLHDPLAFHLRVGMPQGVICGCQNAVEPTPGPLGRFALTLTPLARECGNTVDLPPRPTPPEK